MTIQTFIEKAIEGGWTQPPEGTAAQMFMHQTIFLDPEAWKAVGKVEGWWHCTVHVDGGEEVRCEDPKHDDWFKNMHRMIDALAEGKSIEEFITTL